MGNQCEPCHKQSKTAKGEDVSYGAGKKRHKLSTNKKLNKYDTRTGSIA